MKYLLIISMFQGGFLQLPGIYSDKAWCEQKGTSIVKELNDKTETNYVQYVCAPV